MSIMRLTGECGVVMSVFFINVRSPFMGSNVKTAL